MATWKKIITSGSNADLNQITASAVKFPDDSISGDVIDGGTIGSTTITALAGNLSLGDNNITNVGSLAADSIVVDDASVGLNITFGGNTGLNKITLTDNLADALNITEDTNSYLKFITTNTSEEILFGENATFEKNVSGSATSTGSFGHLMVGGTNYTNTQLDSAIAANAVTALNNKAENRLVTIGSTTTELDGESNLFFDGSDLTLTGNGAKIEFFDENGDEHISADNAGVLSINAGTEIDLTTTTVDINGAVDISGNTTIGGNLTVNGVTTTVSSTNVTVGDAFIFLATGSQGTNVDAGIVVQSGSTADSGSALYHDTDSERWSVGKQVGSTDIAVTPTSFVTTVKTDTVNPDTTSGSYGAGEMHVNTSTGEIWIRFG